MNCRVLFGDRKVAVEKLQTIIITPQCTTGTLKEKDMKSVRETLDIKLSITTAVSFLPFLPAFHTKKA